MGDQFLVQLREHRGIEAGGVRVPPQGGLQSGRRRFLAHFRGTPYALSPLSSSGSRAVSW